MQNNLSADIFASLSDIFKDKGWEIDNDADYGMFNRFCKTLEKFNKKQQELILDLTKKFIYIPLTMYLDKLVPIFVQLISGTKQRDILIINSLPNKQYGFVKSNYIVSYIAKGLALKHRVDFKNKKIRVIDSVKNLLKYKDLSKSTLVFVDDFIGTGKTTINAILYIQHRLQANGKAEPQYSVLSIAAMEQGIQEIKRLDIPVFNSVTLKRGISDYYFGEELESKKELMKSISIKLKKVNNSFLMGYDSSEALICMERCPNNTFPVFWMGRNIAPYER